MSSTFLEFTDKDGSTRKIPTKQAVLDLITVIPDDSSVGYDADNRKYFVKPAGIVDNNTIVVNSDGKIEATNVNAGTVTSVGVSVPTGFAVSGSPVTSEGTIAISYDAGYVGYTEAEQTKLSGIQSGAEQNVQADWNQESTVSDSYIQNKPEHGADWSATEGFTQILNKPELATVATTGSYGDLTNKPDFATVATTGSYEDLVDKPDFATVATTGSYNDLIDTDNVATKTEALSALILGSDIIEPGRRLHFNSGDTPELSTTGTTYPIYVGYKLQTTLYQDAYFGEWKNTEEDDTHLGYFQLVSGNALTVLSTETSGNTTKHIVKLGDGSVFKPIAEYYDGDAWLSYTGYVSQYITTLYYSTSATTDEYDLATNVTIPAEPVQNLVDVKDELERELDDLSVIKANRLEVASTYATKTALETGLDSKLNNSGWTTEIGKQLVVDSEGNITFAPEGIAYAGPYATTGDIPNTDGVYAANVMFLVGSATPYEVYVAAAPDYTSLIQLGSTAVDLTGYLQKSSEISKLYGTDSTGNQTMVDPATIVDNYAAKSGTNKAFVTAIVTDPLDPNYNLGITQADISGLGGGTVTSVGVSVPTGLTVSGSPITSSGTIDIAYDTGYTGYTEAEKTKLATVQENAEENVQSDWNVTDNTSDAYIANKPEYGADWNATTGFTQIQNKPDISVFANKEIAKAAINPSKEVIIPSGYVIAVSTTLSDYTATGGVALKQFVAKLVDTPALENGSIYFGIYSISAVKSNVGYFQWSGETDDEIVPIITALTNDGTELRNSTFMVPYELSAELHTFSPADTAVLPDWSELIEVPAVPVQDLQNVDDKLLGFIGELFTAQGSAASGSNQFAKKETDFVTPIDDTNKGITQADISSLGMGTVTTAGNGLELSNDGTTVSVKVNTLSGNAVKATSDGTYVEETRNNFQITLNLQSDDITLDAKPSTVLVTAPWNYDQTATMYDSKNAWYKLPEKEKYDCDVFVIYPTVTFDYNKPDNISINDQEMFEGVQNFVNQSIAPALTGVPANVYIPKYRQVNGAAFLDDNTCTWEKLYGMIADGAADIANAFKYYLENCNHGNKLVIISHSQGSSILYKIIDEKLRNLVDKTFIKAIYMAGMTPPTARLTAITDVFALQGAQPTDGIMCLWNTATTTEVANKNRWTWGSSGNSDACVNPITMTNTAASVLKANNAKSNLCYFQDLIPRQQANLTGALVTPCAQTGAYVAEVLDIVETDYLLQQQIQEFDNMNLGYAHLYDIALFSESIKNSIITKAGLSLSDGFDINDLGRSLYNQLPTVIDESW